MDVERIIAREVRWDFLVQNNCSVCENSRYWSLVTDLQYCRGEVSLTENGPDAQHPIIRTLYDHIDVRLFDYPYAEMLFPSVNITIFILS